MDPLVFPEFGVEGSFLQPLQLQREPRPQLLQLRPGLLLLLAVYVPMMAHEYEVSLVMKRHDLTTLELWLLDTATVVRAYIRHHIPTDRGVIIHFIIFIQ